MALVKKLNVELTVEDSLVETYVSKGYDVIDANGKVIREAIPNDLNQLRIMVVKQKDKIAELEAEIANLKASKEAHIVEAPLEEPKKRGRKKATPVEE